MTETNKQDNKQTKQTNRDENLHIWSHLETTNHEELYKFNKEYLITIRNLLWVIL